MKRLGYDQLVGNDTRQAGKSFAAQSSQDVITMTPEELMSVIQLSKQGNCSCRSHSSEQGTPIENYLRDLWPDYDGDGEVYSYVNYAGAAGGPAPAVVNSRHTAEDADDIRDMTPPTTNWKQEAQERREREQRERRTPGKLESAPREQVGNQQAPRGIWAERPDLNMDYDD